MAQIVWNYLIIFVFPALIGGGVRFLSRRRKKAWIVTAVFALLTAVAVIIAVNPPVSGNEGYGLSAVMAGCATIASFLVGLVFRIKQKFILP